jgi:hypothetical protein
LGLSTVGSGTYSPGGPALTFVRWLDLVLLLLAAPLFLLADLPFEGYLAGGAAWIVQRAIQLAVARRAAASEDPRSIVGLLAGSMIARGWIVALSIFGIGLTDEDAGLAAAVLVISLFTVYFAVQLALRPLDVHPGAQS